MAGIHLVLDGGAALPLGGAEGYGLALVAHHVSQGLDRFHAGTADPDTLGRVLALPGARVLPASQEELADAYRDAARMGVAVCSLHSPAALLGTAPAAGGAAVLAGLPAASLAVRELPIIGPALGLVGLRIAQAAQDPVDLQDLADAAVALAGETRTLAAAPDPAAVLRRAAELGLRAVGPAAVRAAASSSSSVAWLSFRIEVGGAGGRIRLLGVQPDGTAALRAAATGVRDDVGRARANGTGGGGAHLAAAGFGADAEIAALATFLDTQLGLAEAWTCAADPVSALLGGPGSYGLAWYTESVRREGDETAGAGPP